MDWLILILAGLTTCQITETFRHGSIFEPIRAKLESSSEFLNELINCGFCFSHWAGALTFILVLGHYISASFGVTHNIFFCILIYFSCIRLANLLNDGTKFFSRTPKVELKTPDSMEWENE